MVYHPPLILFEDVMGAVARGWCSSENSAKEMDANLATAITREIMKLLVQVELAK